MKHKIIFVFLIVMLIQYCCCFVFAENIINNQENSIEQTNTQESLLDKQKEVEKQLNEEQTKLEYVKSELSSNLLRVQELEDKVLDYEKQMRELSDTLTDLEDSINKEQEKLKVVEEDYNEKYELLRERLVSLYESGQTTYLDVLLSSKNIVDFISGYYFIEELVEYDNSLITKVQTKKEEIENTKTKLEREEVQAKMVKAKKEQTTLVLQNTITLQKNEIAKLNNEEKKIQEEITKYKQEQIKIEQAIKQATNTEANINIQYTGGEMLWPVAISGTCITSEYGLRVHPIQGIVSGHSGIDIGNADYGSPIVAAADGVVSYAGWLSGYGNCVMINHGNGLTTLYGHGQKILTELHKEVKKGDLIMEVGSTGNSTGPHLHFEVRVNGNTVNPLNYVKVP